MGRGLLNPVRILRIIQINAPLIFDVKSPSRTICAHLASVPSKEALMLNVFMKD